MLTNGSFERVYLARGTTDLRKSIDGLAIIVQECFDLDPFSPCLFVFCNRKRDKLKILQWEHNGFWLHYAAWSGALFIGPQRKTLHRWISARVSCGGCWMGCRSTRDRGIRK